MPTLPFEVWVSQHPALTLVIWHIEPRVKQDVDIKVFRKNLKASTLPIMLSPCNRICNLKHCRALSRVISWVTWCWPWTWVVALISKIHIGLTKTMNHLLDIIITIAWNECIWNAHLHSFLSLILCLKQTRKTVFRKPHPSWQYFRFAAVCRFWIYCKTI